MTDLWSLTVAFTGTNSTLRLLYEGVDPAKRAYEALAKPRQSAEEYDRGLQAMEYDPDIEITDTYGSTVTLDRNLIMVRWLTNLGQQAEGMKAEQILNAHAQASLQRKLSGDPMLKNFAPPAQQFNLKPQ
jgi:hypothetical protein